MPTHVLEPERRTLHGQFSPELAPVLTVASGDTVRYRTIDVAWGLEPPTTETAPRLKFEPRDAPRDDGPALIGPVAVEGARPGDILEIHIEIVRPVPWGWTWAGGPGKLNAALGVADEPARLVRWSLDPDARLGTNQLGHTVDLHPFLGTIGVAPSGPGWQSAWPPRVTGGNLDCKELVAGSTLYLPVAVDGALVSVGDGHAAQGDGELSGMAIECPMELVELRFVVRKDLHFRAPMADTPAGWVSFGVSEDLDEAVTMAVNGMLDMVQERFALSRQYALALASVAVDVCITQLVNGVRGVHAILPHGAIR